jgi:4-amino-4-deoxy-L-arabinose transferase-like glycosyltransferase
MASGRLTLAGQQSLSSARSIAPAAILFLAYFALRLLTLSATSILEDHDSVGYLNEIEVFLTFDLGRILELSPDSTPVFPLVAALLSLPGWSVETGARLASLLSSALLFWAVYGIARHLARPGEGLLGLVFLTLSPPMMALSVSVLSELTYITLIYAGLWVYLVQQEKPSLWTGAVLGLVFSLGFLTRVEGVLFLAFIPVLQASHLWVARNRRRYTSKRLASWSAVYILVFCLVAAPQVWRVSQQLGTFAINGRQLWALVLNTPDGKSYEEKIYGLEYSDGQTNLKYLQSHPDVQRQVTSGFSLGRHLRRIVVNVEDLHEIQLGVLVGPLGLVFASFGLLALCERKRYFEAWVVCAFVTVALVAPLMHNVVMRHIAIIAPMTLVVAGIGVADLARRLAAASPALARRKPALIFLLVLAAACLEAPSLRRNFRSRSLDRWSNREYDPEALSAPAAVVASVAQNELGRQAFVVARKRYLPHLAGARAVALPLVDYERLVRYCRLNGADFLFLEHRFLREYPFLDHFANELASRDFELLYSATDSRGRKIELHRFRPGQADG